MSAKAGSYSADMDQAPYWVAILVAMNIMLLSDIRQLVPSPATGIVFVILPAHFLPVSAPHGSRATRDAWFKQWHGLLAATSGSEQARASDR